MAECLRFPNQLDFVDCFQQLLHRRHPALNGFLEHRLLSLCSRYRSNRSGKDLHVGGKAMEEPDYQKDQTT